MTDPSIPEAFPLDEAVPGPPPEDAAAPPLPAQPTLLLTPDQLADLGLGECAPGDQYTATLTAGTDGEFTVDSVIASGPDGEDDADYEDMLGYPPDDRRKGRGAGAPLDFGKLQSTVS